MWNIKRIKGKKYLGRIIPKKNEKNGQTMQYSLLTSKDKERQECGENECSNQKMHNNNYTVNN